MANVLLEKTGFKAELGGAQGTNTLFLMRMVYTLLPAIAMIGIFWLIRHFRLDEARCHSIRKVHESRRGSL